jgi:hypothetical protein
LVPGRGVTVGGTGVALALDAAAAELAADDVLVRLLALGLALLATALVAATLVAAEPLALRATDPELAVTVAAAPPQALSSMLVPVASIPTKTARRATGVGDPSDPDRCCIAVALLSVHPSSRRDPSAMSRGRLTLCLPTIVRGYGE